MPREPYQPRLVSYTDLPSAIQQAGIARIETQQKRGTVIDLMNIPKATWELAQMRFAAIR